MAKPRVECEGQVYEIICREPILDVVEHKFDLGDDALDDHAWVSEQTTALQEAKVLESLPHDIEIPCVVRWRMLWFSAPTSLNNDLLNDGVILEKALRKIS